MKRAIVVCGMVAVALWMAVPASAAGPYTQYSTSTRGGDGSANGSWTATATADANGAFDLTATAAHPTLAVNGNPAWAGAESVIGQQFDGVLPGNYTATLTINVANAEASAQGTGQAGAYVLIHVFCYSCDAMRWDLRTTATLHR
jgi:hypothetical protein